MSWFDGAGDGSVIDPSELLDTTADDAVVELLRGGAMVTLAMSRDGGALGVTVTRNGRWRREWFRDADNLGAWLLGAVQGVAEANGRTSPPPASQPSSGRRGGQGRSRAAGGGTQAE